MLAVVLAILAKLVVIFKTRIEEHIKMNNKSHIVKHLHSTGTCFGSYNCLCFKIIDKVNSKLDLKIKEALNINWRKPDTTKSFSSHPLTIASVPLAPFCLCFSFVVFAILFHLLFSLSLCWLLVPFSELITLCYYFVSL